jgi:hypothetical protein
METTKLDKHKTMSTHDDVPRFNRGSRAIFIRKDHPRDGEYCILLNQLPNPSQRSTSQWYDVRFDDNRLLRCHERDLQFVNNDVSAKPIEALGKTESTDDKARESRSLAKAS